jgi:hypothetical protein
MTAAAEREVELTRIMDVTRLCHTKVDGVGECGVGQGHAANLLRAVASYTRDIRQAIIILVARRGLAATPRAGESDEALDEVLQLTPELLVREPFLAVKGTLRA